MEELTREQIKKMTPAKIHGMLRTAARYEREHKGITFEHGTNLINLVAVHGDQLANRLECLDTFIAHFKKELAP